MKRFTDEGRTLVCFDFDETYFPHACSADQLASVRRLEDFLERHSSSVSTMWVTGSSLASIHEKAKRANLRFWPHRIASSLGTELYRIETDGTFVEDKAYQEPFPSDFVSRVERIVSQTGQMHIELDEQPGNGMSPWIRSYYVRDQVGSWRETLRMLTDSAGIAVNMSRCNPKAGDPADAFDVDFYPKHAGKVSSLEYVYATASFSREDTYAFGDSGNDISMLAYVGNGYLVNNATEQAKQMYPEMTTKPYAEGILEVLESDLSSFI
ncbi:HAD-IIB family hydrolase [Exiguobacterium sp. PBE]|uniref:HAD-IIB family hydrolase n=1 Tax=unclassified Exiguobacterium TaxID=2644629 RepID=UPI0018C446B1|nr:MULTISPECIES: HAD-IIB family hydrolase [unclassified Exiguobacterium]MBG0918221.1 HAD-IIB family hydrolase [Exiguobacterium sp. SRB7LM]MDT0192754.1 HAD-IIB family hydrolase [Exiguobacterium sp. BG5(2022)]QPI67955.1 HAD-IIB family hydrolase [Exiguobacterium sp. PBE]